MGMLTFRIIAHLRARPCTPRPGAKLRLVTDRNLVFGEHAKTRLRYYSVGAIDLVLTPGEGSRTLLPACKLTVDKNKQ